MDGLVAFLAVATFVIYVAGGSILFLIASLVAVLDLFFNLKAENGS